MSTRQATPGPSNVPALNTISVNSRKRGVSLSDTLSDSVRSPKKSKGEDPKDKKKRRKKRRKIAVTTPTILSLQSSSRSRSKSRTAEPKTPIVDSAETQPMVSVTLVVKKEEEKETKYLVEEDQTSEPNVDKGKGKAKEESPPILGVSNSLAHQEEIERLKKELDAQKSILQQHQSHLTQIQQSLSCEICLDLMHRPFALAPCGHVACHSCLVSWFTREGERVIGFPRRQIHLNRKKTCPVCRASITQRPAEIWGLKSMVNNLQKSGLIEPVPLPLLVPTASTSGEHSPANAPDENPNDPWHNIFRPIRAGGDRNLSSAFEGHGGDNIEEIGMYDAEDGGIYRCLDCMHEIWGDHCSACGRIYPGHNAEDDGDDADDIDDDHPMLRDLFTAIANGDLMEDYEEDYDSEIEHGLFDDYEEEDEEDEDEELEEDEEEEVFGEEMEYRGGGAIAFENMAAAHVGHPFAAPMPLGSHWIHEASEDEEDVSAYIEEVGGSEDDDDDGYHGHAGHFEPNFINDDESSDGDSDGSSIYARPAVSGPRGSRTVVFSDDEDDEDNEVQFMGRGRGAGSRYRNGQRFQGTANISHGRNTVIISSDEE